MKIKGRKDNEYSIWKKKAKTNDRLPAIWHYLAFLFWTNLN